MEGVVWGPELLLLLELPLGVRWVGVAFPLAEVGPVLAACNLTRNAGSEVHPGCEYTCDGKLRRGWSSTCGGKMCATVALKPCLRVTWPNWTQTAFVRLPGNRKQQMRVSLGGRGGKTRLLLNILVTFHNKSPSPSALVSWAVSARVLCHPLWPSAWSQTAQVHTRDWG